MKPLNLIEYEEVARARLSKMAYAYYAGGADDEVTLAANRAAWARWALHYRVLVDVSRRDLRTTVLGQPLAMPVLVAPTAFHRLAHPEGEAAAARAAAAAGIVFVLSTLATCAVEEVAGAAPERTWFQLYVYKDRGVTRALVERAVAAGAAALVLTVDAPFIGRRERDVRTGFHLPPGLAVENLLPAGMRAVPGVPADSGLAAYVSSLLDPALTWRDVDWLAGLTRLPLLVKGIVRPDDALRALEHGARAVVVSNHGGRQLDGAPATADVLPQIAEAVDGRLELLVDGGVRRGTDVLKALALGARAVLVGRPVLWGLAAGGAEGVAHVLELLRAEIDLAMALCGCADVAAIGRDLVARAP